MFRNNKEVLKFTTLLMAMVMIAMVILPALPVMAVEDPYTAKAEQLIQNIYDKYMEDGKVLASSPDGFDGFTIYVLNEAEVDVLNWKYEGVTIEDKLDALITDAIDKEATTSTAINAKFMAMLYIAAESSDKTTEAGILLNNLKIRQSNTINGGFVDGDYSSYTNIPVFDILTIAEKLNILEKPDTAFEYVKNLNPTTGDWPDFMTISETARVLKAFEVQLSKTGTSEKIQPNLVWLKDTKDTSGSFNTDGDVATNTSEVLWTIDSIGTSETLTLQDKEDALEFLLDKNDYNNIGANAWAIKSFLLNGATPNIDPTSTSAGTDPTPTTERIKVDVAVIDDDGDVIYGPKSVRLNLDDKFGFTARGALHETGLDYDATNGDKLVVEIEGVKNKGLSGWMYAVNGKSPGKSANDYELKDGDEVLWFYSKSSTAKVPRFPDEEDEDTVVDKVVEKPIYVIPLRKTFADVGVNILWAKDAIELLAGRGIIAGTGTGQFEPNRSINRAEFAKLVIETLGDKSLSQGTAMFSDVDSTKWYADYIGRAFTKGLIEGSNGKFRPMESITRNEVAVILHRMQNKPLPNNGTISFKDGANIPDWARNSVAYAVERGLIQGYNDNTFRGEQPMTRAEVAVVLYRYIQMMNL